MTTKAQYQLHMMFCTWIPTLPSYWQKQFLQAPSLPKIIIRHLVHQITCNLVVGQLGVQQQLHLLIAYS